MWHELWTCKIILQCINVLAHCWNIVWLIALTDFLWGITNHTWCNTPNTRLKHRVSLHKVSARIQRPLPHKWGYRQDCLLEAVELVKKWRLLGSRQTICHFMNAASIGWKLYNKTLLIDLVKPIYNKHLSKPYGDCLPCRCIPQRPV